MEGAWASGATDVIVCMRSWIVGCYCVSGWLQECPCIFDYYGLLFPLLYMLYLSCRQKEVFVAINQYLKSSPYISNEWKLVFLILLYCHHRLSCINKKKIVPRATYLWPKRATILLYFQSQFLVVNLMFTLCCLSNIVLYFFYCRKTLLWYIA
jgi:hypothetical protein